MSKTKIEWTDELIKRFWGYVNKTPNCWLWKAGCFSKGYGQFRVGKKKVRAHRFAYELIYGTILRGVSVCHTCDNPKCVNPKHLFLATAKGNALDREAKKRHPHLDGYDKSGANNPATKLTQRAVQQIKQLRKLGYTYRDLAKRFGVSYSQIGNIIRGESWQIKAK